MSFTIPEPFDEMTLSCGECEGRRPYKGEPDMILGHLIEAHKYTTEQAQRYIEDWMEGFDSDDDGWPLQTCPTHGSYRIHEPCYGCEADEPRDD